MTWRRVAQLTRLTPSKVDVDACDDIAAEAAVKAMPTFIVYRNGKPVCCLLYFRPR